MTGSLSRKTAVLATDGVDPYTAKAQADRQFKTQTVTPATFADLTYYIQPATAEGR